MSNEQLHAQVKERPPAAEVVIPKSLELFTGSPEGSVGYDFNDAVIGAQEEMGSGFYLTEGKFNEFMPSDWLSMPASEALKAFDRGYKQYVLSEMGYTPGEIALETAKDDGASDAELKQISQQYPDPESNAADQQTYDEQFAGILANYDKELERPEEQRVLQSADQPNQELAGDAIAVDAIDNKELTDNALDPAAEAIIQRELNAFDARVDTSAEDRAEFESFLRQQPELLTAVPADYPEDSISYPEQTSVDANPFDPHAGEQILTSSAAEIEREANLKALEIYLLDHPEIADLDGDKIKAEFEAELNRHLAEISSGTSTNS